MWRCALCCCSASKILLWNIVFMTSWYEPISQEKIKIVITSIKSILAISLSLFLFLTSFYFWHHEKFKTRSAEFKSPIVGILGGERVAPGLAGWWCRLQCHCRLHSHCARSAGPLLLGCTPLQYSRCVGSAAAPPSPARLPAAPPPPPTVALHGTAPNGHCSAAWKAAPDTLGKLDCTV